MKLETPKKTTEVARIIKDGIETPYMPYEMIEHRLKIDNSTEVVRLAGNEIVTIGNREDEIAAYVLRETCENPSELNAEASRTRMELVNNLGAEALVLVADTAETIGAKNSLEKMLAGEIGVTHYLMMNIARRINEMILYDVPSFHHSELERAELDASVLAKYTASFSRLAKVMDGHLQTLQKMRTGGRQTVTVQHVQVAANQAIVGNNITAPTGSREPGER